MMILISAQIEIERANFACDFDFNRKQQTRLLEGEHECFFKLHKPITFQVTGNEDNGDKNDDDGDDDFYGTHVHMGSDHWVAMSVTTYIRTYKTFLTPVDDPS